MDRLKQEGDDVSPMGSSVAVADSAAATDSSVGYTDYILRSSDPSSSSGWRHNIMKFNALGDRVIDLNDPEMEKPLKLNRKDPRTVRRLNDAEREKMNKNALQAITGLAGGEGMDVELVKSEQPFVSMWKKNRSEREQMDVSLVGTGVTGQGPAVRDKKNLFKKKTKRVFVSSEEARRLKREEWMPWVLEDDDGNHRWIGRLAGGAGEPSTGQNDKSISLRQNGHEKQPKPGTDNKGWRPAAAASEFGGGGTSYVAFVFGENGDDFQVIPVHRWYRFSQGPNYATLGTEEAEKEYNRQQQSQEDSRWLMHRRLQASATAASLNPTATSSGNSTPTPTLSQSATSTIKRESTPNAFSVRSRLLTKSGSTGRQEVDSKVLGRPKFRTIIKSEGGENGDDELRGRISMRRDETQDQGDDEFDYEEDFQDDEEGTAKIDDLADEEETKELEDRIRKEMRAANRAQEDLEDINDEEDEKLTNTGREVKKIVKKVDKDAVNESDDEENPYASSEYDSDEEVGSVASLDINEKPEGVTAQQAAIATSSYPDASPLTKPNHRSHSRHSNVHSRQHSTSNSRAGSRSVSPTAGFSGSAVIAKRATSPGGWRSSTPGSRATSPGAGIAGKRKRDLEEADAAKRRRNGRSTSPSTDPSDAKLITEADLISLLKTKPSFTTSEVLRHFRRLSKPIQGTNKQSEFSSGRGDSSW